jgi:hypothetical protein
MALAFTYKSSLYSTTGAATYTGSPTWTPAANSLVVCFVVTTGATTWTTDPSGVTGHGLTYSKLTLGTSTLGTTHKLSAWVAKAGASPTSVAPVASVSGSPTGCALIEFEVTGHDDSGTALQAIVDSTATNNGTSTTPSVNLAAAGHANNRGMIFVVQQSNTAPTATDWTLTAGAAGNYNTPATGAAAYFKTSAFDTSGTATTANVAWRMIGIEVKAATVSLPTVTTQAASSVAEETATGNGNITATGNEDADARGVVYSTSTQGAPGNVAPASSGYSGVVTASGTFGTGAFTSSLTTLDPATTYYARAYAHNSAGYAYGSEVNFTTLDWPIRLAASSNITASGENTTAQLAAPSGKTTADFVAGRLQDDENPADSVDITSDDYTELEWNLKAITGVAADADVYQFRVTVAGTPVDTYSVTPQWTIGTPSVASRPPYRIASRLAALLRF